NTRCRHQGAVGEWDAQQRRLRSADELLVLTGRLIADLAVGTGVVGGEERTDDELAGFHRGDRATHLLDDAAILVPHGGRRGDRADASVWPQIRPAHTGGRDPDDGIRGLDDRGAAGSLKGNTRRAEGTAPRLFPT